MKKILLMSLLILCIAIPSLAAEIYKQSQIAGEFRGWKGNTVIELMDGSAWQQTDRRVLNYYYSWPMVTIYIQDGHFFASVYDTDPVNVRQVR